MLLKNYAHLHLR